MMSRSPTETSSAPAARAARARHAARAARGCSVDRCAVAPRRRAGTRLDAANFHHSRDWLPLVRRPRHGRGLDGVRAGPSTGSAAGALRARRDPSAHGRPVVIRMSPPMSVRASPVITMRTLSMTERSVTIAATPSARQAKKNSRRFQAARVSRSAMRRTNITAAPPARASTARGRAVRPSGPVACRQARGQLGIVRHEHQGRAVARD